MEINQMLGVLDFDFITRKDLRGSTREGKPVIKNAKMLSNGSVTGQVYNDTHFPDGMTITTSKVKEVITQNTHCEVEF